MTDMSSPAKFRVRSDAELQALDDDALIEYICASRDAGELAATRRAVQILTWGLMSMITARMRLRVPGQYLEEASMEAFEKAARGSFRGESIGQFRSWCNAIINGTANDVLRRHYRERAALGVVASLDDESLHEESRVVSESGAVELGLVAEEVLATMNDEHRIVIELHVFEGLTAPEVCEQLDGMSPDNVAQIASRFRKRMREALDDGT